MRILDETDIDLILLDVSMPDMDGLELLRTLKNSTHNNEIPVIMVTGKIFSENEQAIAYRNGAVDSLL